MTYLLKYPFVVALVAIAGTASADTDTAKNAKFTLTEAVAVAEEQADAWPVSATPNESDDVAVYDIQLGKSDGTMLVVAVDANTAAVLSITDEGVDKAEANDHDEDDTDDQDGSDE